MTFPPLKSPLKFYAVVPTADWVERMVKAGADTVQLRCKTLHGDELKREIERCVAACQNSATQLFINDHWREAIAAGAYGIHLGQEDMDTADLAAIEAAGLRLGLSTHSVAELDRALSVHPSYVASGAIFPTTTKQMPTAPQGLDKLREYVRQARGTPVVAIGGIHKDNLLTLAGTGIAGVALVTAIFGAEDIAKECTELREMVAKL